MLRTAAVILTLAPLAAHSAPTMNDPFLFTERRAESTFWTSDWTFVIGSTSVVPSGAGTTVQATYAGEPPLVPWANYDVPFAIAHRPAPPRPNQYALRTPYVGQTGQWDVAATDASGTTVRRTHVLDDVRDLPLLTGVTISGPALAPHIAWNPVNGLAFPSWCGPGIGLVCALGTDFFVYSVEVRLAEPSAPLLYQSPAIPTLIGFTLDATPTMFDIPAGILSAGGDYFVSVLLVHNEIEAFLDNNRLFSPLENRSSTWAAHSVPVPEPETYALLFAGLGLLGFVARRRRAQ